MVSVLPLSHFKNFNMIREMYQTDKSIAGETLQVS